MNKKDIIESLTKVLSTKKEARDAVEMTFSEIKRALRESDKVVISGFGSFQPHVTRAKKGRNPKTGQTIHIPPRKKVRFHPSKDILI